MRTGTVIAGKYRIDAPIAKGGMGAVWAAHHLTLDKPIAVKFIHATVEENIEARRRFEREARAAASLKSPHVVQIYDYGIDDGVPYLVMELLEGEDLGACLARVGKLALPDAVSVVSQAAHALGRAAAAGIVHRDLKPSNIFIVHDGDDEIVKILDFGIAKTQRAPRVDLDDTTRTGTLIGSPRYMSPEQARSSRVLDHRSDLWSLAVIAYRAITGQLPFTGEDVGDLLVKICAETATPPSQIDPSLDPAIDAFFTKALARLPDERFQTARELATALAEAAGEPVPLSVTSTRLSLVSLPAVPPPAPAPARAAPAPPPLPSRDVLEIEPTRASSQPAPRRAAPGDRLAARSDPVTAPEPFSRRRGATPDAAQTPANGSIDVPARSGHRPARRARLRRTTLGWFVVAGALAAVLLDHSPTRFPASRAPAPAGETAAATAPRPAAPAAPVAPVPTASVMPAAPPASTTPASPTASAGAAAAPRRPAKPGSATKKQNPVLGI